MENGSPSLKVKLLLWENKRTKSLLRHFKKLARQSCMSLVLAKLKQFSKLRNLQGVILFGVAML